MVGINGRAWTMWGKESVPRTSHSVGREVIEHNIFTNMLQDMFFVIIVNISTGGVVGVIFIPNLEEKTSVLIHSFNIYKFLF